MFTKGQVETREPTKLKNPHEAPFEVEVICLDCSESYNQTHRMHRIAHVHTETELHICKGVTPNKANIVISNSVLIRMSCLTLEQDTGCGISSMRLQSLLFLKFYLSF